MLMLNFTRCPFLGGRPFECGWQKTDFKTASFAVEMSNLAALEV
jgi:hypothetical protein